MESGVALSRCKYPVMEALKGLGFIGGKQFSTYAKAQDYAESTIQEVSKESPKKLSPIQQISLGR